MMHTARGWRWAIGVAVLLASMAARAEELRASTDAAAVEFFEAKVRPVLVEHCYKCHSVRPDKKPKGELLLDSREAMLKGGESGEPAVMPGDAERSRLILAVRQ